ncbi:adenylate/guanylate cyclase domain-containing protein [Bradyrhizobium quebecense]|uniref:adenylate/guanylate cyclase domain-containing protein n=1 Tax=Bradyrhizobium quebecense TaxID=2748629 RepID=UPI0030B832DB
MIKRSIRRRIVAIAVGLIVLMVTTSILSIVMVGRVGHLLDELTDRYIPANTHLTRINILSLERALALRRMVIAKMQDPPDELGYKTRKQLYEAKDAEVDTEADAAHKLISAVIDDTSTPSDNTALARIDSRIDSLVGEFRHHLRQESGELLAALDARDFAAARRSLGRTDTLRDEYTEKVEAIRAEMLKVSYGAVATIRSEQTRAVQTSATVTALAAIVGLIFANLVSGGIIRSVRKLLDGTRAVEAGHLEQSIDVRTTDEIGQLAAAFNRMVEQLRTNQRVRETFGKYVDPRVVEGLIERPNLTAAEGQRRVMTVLFCDLRGFTSLGEGMTPQGLVKVMNRYLSIMSEPIRTNRGIIDKYIGDGIMAYWGPPFVDDADHALFACLAAVEMIDRIATLRREIPELLGVLGTPMETCDLRIGIATGEALVGSIGSDVMMSYTVMGDVVNFASRLEGANKVYGTRNLASERTIAAAAAALEVREIDRVVVAGHTRFEVVFEILGSKGKLLPQQLALRDSYLEGLAAYREQRWDDALAKFGAALEAMPATDHRSLCSNVPKT